MRPPPNIDIMKLRPRNANVMKMAADIAEATATSATAYPPKLEPAFVSLFVRLAICPHLHYVERAMGRENEVVSE